MLVTPWGVGVSAFPEKKRYKGVRFNVISVVRGWVGVKFPGKKRYVTLEWRLMDCIMKFLIRNAYLPVTIFQAMFVRWHIRTMHAIKYVPIHFPLWCKCVKRHISSIITSEHGCHVRCGLITSSYCSGDTKQLVIGFHSVITSAPRVKCWHHKQASGCRSCCSLFQDTHIGVTERRSSVL